MKRSGTRSWLGAAAVVCIVVAYAVVAAGPAGAAGAQASEDAPKQQRESVTIGKNNEFNPANGVRSGSGTKSDPFVISGWEIDTIRIHDTNKYVVIRDNVVTGTLVLDWIGDRVTVVNNTVQDLRVNQNVERTGDMTSGLIAHNTFGVVGQLRHWDGIFEHNTVGTPGEMEIPFFLNEAVNFDGFNGGIFRNNTVYGYVNATLHGHHHSSGFGSHSHDHAYTPPKPVEEGHEGHAHAAKEDPKPAHEDMDHTVRYHQVFISNNKIYAGGPYALRYTDQNHAANDRTATSETNPELNKPHVHHTQIHITGNQLYGSGIAVDIFNADDERHLETARGLVHIADNSISLERADAEFSTLHGIAINDATDITLRVVGNSIKQTAADTDNLTQLHNSDAGIWLGRFDLGNLEIADNSVTDMAYGVYARELSKTVDWSVFGLKTNRVGMDLYYDNSVQNQPRRSP
ncbi:MAG TPA: hypothetical protein VIG64_14065 [Actinomycetota bacterium]|jgi:hypothetical protein